MLDARVSPPKEKTIEQLRIEISHLDHAIAALERYASLTTGVALPHKTKRDIAKAAVAGQS